MAFNSKTTGRRAKRSEIEIQGQLFYIYRVIWPYTVQVQFEVIRCTCLRMACIVERNGVKFGTRTLLTYMWGTYDLVVFKVILGSFGALVSK